MKLNDDGILVPYKLTEEELMWKIGYYFCLGKTADEIESILKNFFECEVGTGYIKALRNKLKEKVKVKTSIQLILYFKENKLTPFNEAHY